MYIMILVYMDFSIYDLIVGGDEFDFKIEEQSMTNSCVSRGASSSLTCTRDSKYVIIN